MYVCVNVFGHIYISRVSDQNGVSLLYIMLEIHHSGLEPSIWSVYMSANVWNVAVTKTGFLLFRAAWATN